MAWSTNAVFSVAAGLAMLLPWSAHGQEQQAPAYLLAPTAQVSSVRALPNLETQLVTEQFSLPGTPLILRSGAVWSPFERLAVRAGVSAAEVSPCPASLADDCRWMLPEDAGEEVGFSVGASWKPLQSLSVSFDYATGPSTPALVALESTAAPAIGIKEDLNLSARLDTRSWGDLEFGLQLSRWNNGLPIDENQPDTAALGLAWELGAFRGDVKSRYMQMIGDGSPESAWNAFDISFAWRTPWNASVSFGARNLLNEPAPSANAMDNVRAEDFLGRVPYVRYQQDL